MRLATARPRAVAPKTVRVRQSGAQQRRGEHDRQRQHRAGQATREEGQAASDAGFESTVNRAILYSWAKAGIAQGHAGQLGQHRLGFVGMDDQADGAEPEQDGGRERGCAVKAFCGKADPVKEGRGEHAAGEAGCVVNRDPPTQGLGQNGADPVVERRIIVKGLAGQFGQQPATTGQDGVDGTQMGEIVTAPRKVSGGADKQIHGDEQCQWPALERGRQGEAGGGVGHGLDGSVGVPVAWRWRNQQTIKKAAAAAFFGRCRRLGGDQPRR
jgi:hypothetical protein